VRPGFYRGIGGRLHFGIVTVDKQNTTLYASDRDMFVFLADEENRIEIPGRRAGQSGSFARGFFVGNSEVGKSSLFAGFFLFDAERTIEALWAAIGRLLDDLPADECSHYLAHAGYGSI